MPANKRAFVNAMRAKGKGVKYFAIGGQAQTPLTQNQDFGGGIANSYGSFLSLNPTGSLQGAGQAMQGVASALTPQSQYQAQLAPITQLDYTGVIGDAANNALAGYGQTQTNLGNEQALSNQLGQQALGQGPNPAQAALAQNTETNVANQAALMAGQRGDSSNAGLIAREAAQQGAGTQQQAVGQAGTLQAQQQIAAQQNQAALQGQMGSQITNEQNANSSLFGAGAGANNTQNANLISDYGMEQGINSTTAQNNAAATQKTMGGVLNGASSVMSMLAEGGEVAPPTGAVTGTNAGMQADSAVKVPLISMDTTKGIDWTAPHYAEGGPVSQAGQFLNPTQEASGVGQSAPLVIQQPTPASTDDSSDKKSSGAGAGALLALLNKGGVAKKPVSGEVMAAKGLSVPGKAKVPGKDTLKNDTVPAMLSPGEIVLPLHVTSAPDAPQRAMAFVQAIQAKKGLKRK